MKSADEHKECIRPQQETWVARLGSPCTSLPVILGGLRSCRLLHEAADLTPRGLREQRTTGVLRCAQDDSIAAFICSPFSNQFGQHCRPIF